MRLQIMLSELLSSRIHSFCKARGVKTSDLVKMALDDFLNRKGF